jgi:hypothetical protein
MRRIDTRTLGVAAPNFKKRINRSESGAYIASMIDRYTIIKMMQLVRAVDITKLAKLYLQTLK